MFVNEGINIEGEGFFYIRCLECYKNYEGVCCGGWVFVCCIILYGCSSCFI